MKTTCARTSSQGLAVAVLLGGSFTALQVYEYTHASFGFGQGCGVYCSNFFMATAFHGAARRHRHDLPVRLYLRRATGHFTPENHVGFEAAAWYWHFVDVVWLFLFFAIYIWGS